MGPAVPPSSVFTQRYKLGVSQTQNSLGRLCRVGLGQACRFLRRFQVKWNLCIPGKAEVVCFSERSGRVTHSQRARPWSSQASCPGTAVAATIKQPAWLNRDMGFSATATQPRDLFICLKSRVETEILPCAGHSLDGHSQPWAGLKPAARNSFPRGWRGPRQENLGSDFQRCWSMEE